MYNVLSGEIDLSLTTVASFYRHQKWAQITLLDKIEVWLDKQNQKKDSSVVISGGSRNNFSSSSNIFFGRASSADNSNNDDDESDN